MKRYNAGASFNDKDQVGTVVVGIVVALLLIMPTYPRLVADEHELRIALVPRQLPGHPVERRGRRALPVQGALRAARPARRRDARDLRRPALGQGTRGRRRWTGCARCSQRRAADRCEIAKYPAIGAFRAGGATIGFGRHTAGLRRWRAPPAPHAKRSTSWQDRDPYDSATNGVPPRRRHRRSGPLGLAAFAGTTFFLSVVNTNMLGSSVQTIVLGLALFYGGIGQFAAGHVGVRQGQHLRRARVRQLRRVLDVVLVPAQPPADRRQAERHPARRRPVPDGVDDLHRVHDGGGERASRAPCSPCSRCWPSPSSR